MHSEMFCVRFSVLPVFLRSLSLVLLHVRSIYLIPSLSLCHFVSRSRPLFSLLSHSFGYQTTYASVGRRFVTTLFNVHNKLSAPHSVNVLVHIACERASECECVCCTAHIFRLYDDVNAAKVRKNTYTQSTDIPWCYCSYIHDYCIYGRSAKWQSSLFRSFTVCTVHRGLLLSFFLHLLLLCIQTQTQTHIHTFVHSGEHIKISVDKLYKMWLVPKPRYLWCFGCWCWWWWLKWRWQ